jgi:hypothetical protein
MIENLPKLKEWMKKIYNQMGTNKTEIRLPQNSYKNKKYKLTKKDYWQTLIKSY